MKLYTIQDKSVNGYPMEKGTWPIVMGVLCRVNLLMESFKIIINEILRNINIIIF